MRTREVDHHGISVCGLGAYTFKEGDQADQQVAAETRTAPVGAQEEDGTVSVASLSTVYLLIVRYCAAMHAYKSNSESLRAVRVATGTAQSAA